MVEKPRLSPAAIGGQTKISTCCPWWATKVSSAVIGGHTNPLPLETQQGINLLPLLNTQSINLLPLVENQGITCFY
jgi:hypothetical protein